MTRTTGSIPIVDVEPLTSGEACPQTLSALRQANQEAGFVYVRNHGIASSVIDAARQKRCRVLSIVSGRKVCGHRLTTAPRLAGSGGGSHVR